jgi:hypothetical protein
MKDLCIRIEEDSRGFELPQGIPKEELLKTLEGGSSFKCKELKPKNDSRNKSSKRRSKDRVVCTRCKRIVVILQIPINQIQGAIGGLTTVVKEDVHQVKTTVEPL